MRQATSKAPTWDDVPAAVKLILSGDTRTNSDAHLPNLAASANTLAVLLTGQGQCEQIEGVWRNAQAGLPGSVTTRLRLLRAGWEWIRSSTHAEERAYLRAHPELLRAGSETHLIHVLRYQHPDQARHYLTIVDAARRTNIDAAYRTALTGSEEGSRVR